MKKALERKFYFLFLLLLIQRKGECQYSPVKAELQVKDWTVFWGVKPEEFHKIIQFSIFAVMFAISEAWENNSTDAKVLAHF